MITKSLSGDRQTVHLTPTEAVRRMATTVRTLQDRVDRLEHDRITMQIEMDALRESVRRIAREMWV